MKILNKLLSWLVGIAVFANVIILILGIFYFFDVFLFKLWIAELVATLAIVGFKVHVSFVVFESEEEEKW
ncbi:hypothetical protein [Ligilactobacillus salivarius]|uniref:hypothetical protein n=1 Tax=Ligilactobacillus salivarius TaxID=1624 RepID=UPI00237E9C7C|nr:hypothetical protein [Ligilactobacillus salivarius]MDE1525065.1 hypothetical protein [Ligilactobacillus salivarius]